MKAKVIDLLYKNIEGFTKEELMKLVEIPPKPEMGGFCFSLFPPCKSISKITADDCR